jgi:hypothetical protein
MPSVDTDDASAIHRLERISACGPQKLKNGNGPIRRRACAQIRGLRVNVDDLPAIRGADRLRVTAQSAVRKLEPDIFWHAQVGSRRRAAHTSPCISRFDCRQNITCARSRLSAADDAVIARQRARQNRRLGRTCDRGGWRGMGAVPSATSAFKWGVSRPSRARSDRRRCGRRSVARDQVSVVLERCWSALTVRTTGVSGSSRGSGSTR